MSITDLLPWFNLLYVPAVMLLLRIDRQLVALVALQAEHGRRLDRHEADLARRHHAPDRS